MKLTLKTHKCKMCGENFFPQTTSTVRCVNCSDKSYAVKKKVKKRINKLAKRNKEILLSKEEGESTISISRRFKLSPGRINGIIKETKWRLETV